MGRILLLLSAIAALHAGSAAAESRCTPSREGEVACLSGKLCECRHEPGGSLTGRRAGSRWDCGVLRPNCGAAPPDVDRPDERALPVFPAPSPPPGWR